MGRDITSSLSRQLCAERLRGLMKGDYSYEEILGMYPYEALDPISQFIHGELVHFTFKKEVGLIKDKFYYDGAEEMLMKDIYYIEHPEKQPPPEEGFDYTLLYLPLVPFIILVVGSYHLILNGIRHVVEFAEFLIGKD